MTLVPANSFMTLFAALFLICASAHAPDNSDYVQVGLVNGASVLKANNSRVLKANASGTSAIYGQTPQTACEVTLYDHYYEGAKAEYTGDKKALHGTGDFPLGAFKSTSAVKVTGEYCVAYGFTTPDCTGDKGSGIKADTQYEGHGAIANDLGVVGPSTELEKHWGCNDCANCVRVERSVTCECTGGTAATGNDCQTDGAQTCTACNAGYYLSGTSCAIAIKCTNHGWCSSQYELAGLNQAQCAAKTAQLGFPAYAYSTGRVPPCVPLSQGDYSCAMTRGPNGNWQVCVVPTCDSGYHLVETGCVLITVAPTASPTIYSKCTNTGWCSSQDELAGLNQEQCAAKTAQLGLPAYAYSTGRVPPCAPLSQGDYSCAMANLSPNGNWQVCVI